VFDEMFPKEDIYKVVQGPPTAWLLDKGANGGEPKLKPEFEPRMPERACTKNGNPCMMVRENCADDPMIPCAFSCVDANGESCHYEGKSFNSMPATINPLNGMSVPFKLLPTIKYRCPGFVLQGAGEWVTDKKTAKLEEGLQKIPYDKCESLQRAEDSCFCLFISGSGPSSKALFDSVMAPA